VVQLAEDEEGLRLRSGGVRREEGVALATARLDILRPSPFKVFALQTW
jgi:hypothetical protein